MIYSKMSNQYARLDVETTGKLGLVIICYEKAISNLKQARTYFEKDEIEQKARHMQKAMEIVQELQGCLNHEEGGQIARSLDAIYAYIVKRLLGSDVKKDLTGIDECIHILSELQEAWEGIASEEKERTPFATDQVQTKPGLTQIAA